MEKIIEELITMSNNYKEMSKCLGLPDDCEEEYFSDCDEAIEEGESQAYWKIHRDLDDLIRKYSRGNY